MNSETKEYFKGKIIQGLVSRYRQLRALMQLGYELDHAMLAEYNVISKALNEYAHSVLKGE